MGAASIPIWLKDQIRSIIALVTICRPIENDLYVEVMRQMCGAVSDREQQKVN